MDVSSIGRPTTSQTDQDPLLMDLSNPDHIVDITSIDHHHDSSSRSSIDDLTPQVSSHLVEEETTSSSSSSSNGGTQHLPHPSPLTPPQQRSTTSSRRGDDANARPRSPLNSGLWISVELVVTVAQIVAAIVVMVLAKDEHPEAPLFTWVVGYTSGCIATLPILYWRFRTYNRGTRQDSSQRATTSSQGNNNHPSESTPYTAVSVAQAADEENGVELSAAPRNNQVRESLRTRLNGLVDHFKMAIDCFFAVWFVVGNVWIFGGHSSPSDSPKLYRLCIAFLTFSCIGYAMPFILCATICCCLPCLISVLGFRENFSQTRGATAEAINTLPVYRFKSKCRNDLEFSEEGEGGFLLLGSQKKRLISGEDASCCICLTRYGDDEDVRELPCSHVFHVDCVDKWLKINATCPLCKNEVGESSSASS
ncbi:PREDICTED: E3 ubiquitin-protein ligase At1g63170-like [Camelina sativa]|uniref:E3 ubiquitin-protein ligase At1g63170-like n=1 Tax=Camelina sativa TaxID=90675 RepID=A0ABM0SXW0_CAMSA|nr:PREDICTED: E3 ubiquitin-protein ligase At1g63170-like [Camelina sativa]XP_010417711.1 PREDICTED: E3 ubiquitin-protein ligase At1g63170-like [Camelina sativa]XP_010417712.1 PREDICTED: E3 ubiquitin-protein ligase At1g63170-like [Camelina sativa]